MRLLVKTKFQNILFIPIGENFRASSRLRVLDLISLFENIGHHCHVIPYTRVVSGGFKHVLLRKIHTASLIEQEIKNKIAWADLVVIQESLVSKSLIKLIKSKGKKIVYDFSDPMLMLDKEEKFNLPVRLYHKFISVPRCKYTLQNADAAIVENEELLKISKTYTKSFLLRGPINCEKFKPRIMGDEPTIGWTGSPATFEFVKPLFKHLVDLKNSVNFKLVLVGSGVKSFDLPGIDVRCFDWNENTESSILARFDVGLFNFTGSYLDIYRGGGKLFIYMSSGATFIGPNFGISKEVYLESGCGRIFSDENEFKTKLLALLKDRQVLKNEKEKARTFAVKRYSQDYAIQLWSNILKELEDG